MGEDDFDADIDESIFEDKPKPRERDPRRPLVGNAANRQQVKRASEKEDLGSKQQQEDIKKVLSTGEGQRFIWFILTHCKTFESTWSDVPNRIYYNSGKRDVGHWLMNAINRTDPELLLMMMKSAKKGEF